MDFIEFNNKEYDSGIVANNATIVFSLKEETEKGASYKDAGVVVEHHKDVFILFDGVYVRLMGHDNIEQVVKEKRKCLLISKQNLKKADYQLALALKHQEVEDAQEARRQLWSPAKPNLRDRNASNYTRKSRR